MIVKDFQDGLGNFSFILIIWIDPNLHLSLANGHEADREAGANSCETA